MVKPSKRIRTVGTGPGEGVCLGLGSNLGDRIENVRQALILLEDKGVVRQAVSSAYETAPVGFLDQGDFINLAVRGWFDGSPHRLLEIGQEVEKQLGRTPTPRDHPRVIDIDILLFGKMVIRQESLRIPHPSLSRRRFVLAPLAEVAPEVIHPELQLSIRELLSRCPDASRVVRLSVPLHLERPTPSGYNPRASRGRK